MGGSYEQMCQRWAAENVSKIKSISDTALDEMQDIVLDDSSTANPIGILRERYRAAMMSQSPRRGFLLPIRSVR